MWRLARRKDRVDPETRCPGAALAVQDASTWPEKLPTDPLRQGLGLVGSTCLVLRVVVWLYVRDKIPNICSTSVGLQLRGGNGSDCCGRPCGTLRWPAASDALCCVAEEAKPAAQTAARIGGGPGSVCGTPRCFAQADGRSCQTAGDRTEVVGSPDAPQQGD
jgi:hypothetical protein